MRVPLPTLRSFPKLPNKAPIANGSASKNHWQDVISQYQETRKSALPLGSETIPLTFKACATLQSVNQGISVHADAIKLGFESYTSTGNSIMSFYMKCRMMGSALSFFDAMADKDSVSWNSVIHGFLVEDDSDFGLGLFFQARVFNFVPNVSTLVLVLQACWRLEAAAEGLNVHGFIIRSGFFNVLSVQNSLLNMYVQSHDVLSAQILFDEMPERDVISWSVLVTGYAQCGGAVRALQLFREMYVEGAVDVDGLSVVSALQACRSFGDINQGRIIHGHLIRRGFEADLFVANSLIDMYSKCLDVDSACMSFERISQTNLVSWNSMLSGLVLNERYSDTLLLFDSMTKSRIDSDEVTLVSLLQASKRLGLAIYCKCVHSAILRRLFRPNELVLNSLLDAYAKCDLMGHAVNLFDEMPERNVISWSTMIAGFAHNGQPEEAVASFREMLLAQEKPGSVTLLSLLEACTASAELKLSKSAHGLAVRNNLANDLAVGTALLDVYAKCGDINAARKVFGEMPERNILSWNTMIGALGINGCARESLALLHEMESENIKPNGITMLSLLSACSHGGLVKEGLSCFQSMMQDPSLQPGSEHYSCVVDLLGRAGHLEGAFEAIKRMPEGLEAGPAAWGALLSACRSRGNCELGQGAALHVLKLEPLNSAGYLLSSSLYSKSGLQGDTARVRLLMKERGVRVAGGFSLVHVDRKAHKFVSWDGSHPRCKEIYSMVELLHGCMKLEEVKITLW